MLVSSFLIFFTGPGRTWIVGDSIVAHASTNQPQLRGGGITYWKGVGGTRVAGLTNKISRYLSYKVPYPTTIIFHVGTCDLFRSHQGDIRTRVKSNLEAVRNLLPNTRIIWSDILPRREYKEEENKGAGKKITININRFAHSVCKKLGNAHVIKHHSIRPDNASLYCSDNLHLSDAGSEIFRSDLADALIFFNNNPSAIFWPPRHTE